jgi:hypothetical protein
VSKTQLSGHSRFMEHSLSLYARHYTLSTSQSSLMYHARDSQRQLTRSSYTPTHAHRLMQVHRVGFDGTMSNPTFSALVCGVLAIASNGVWRRVHPLQTKTVTICLASAGISEQLSIRGS